MFAWLLTNSISNESLVALTGELAEQNETLDTLLLYDWKLMAESLLDPPPIPKGTDPLLPLIKLNMLTLLISLIEFLDALLFLESLLMLLPNI